MNDNNTASDISVPRGKRLIALIIVLYALPSFLMLAFTYSQAGIANELQLSISALQFLNTLENIALVAGSIIYGVLADRFGRKLLLLVAMGMMVAGALLYPLASSITQFATGRMIAMAGAGGTTLILTLMAAELASDSKRAFVIVLVGTTSILGITAGGALAFAFIEDMGRDWRQWCCLPAP